jgi:hypothetical protein
MEHIHFEVKALTVEESFFHNCSDPQEFNRITLELGYEQMNKEFYVPPRVYILGEKDGQELVAAMDFQPLINFDPVLAQHNLVEILGDLNAKAYAFMMRALIAKFPLFQIRTTAIPQAHKDPNAKESLVAYCDFKDGDRGMMTHTFGKVDDVIFWETKEEVEILPHYVPGRFTRLFECTE